MDADYTGQTQYLMPPIVDSADSEEERKRRAASAMGMPPAVSPGTAAAPRVEDKSSMSMPPATAVAQPAPSAGKIPPADVPAPTPGGMPPAFFEGADAQPRQPQPATAAPVTMPPVQPGPQEKMYEDAAAQPRPELHGVKKFLDILSQMHPVGRIIEENISGSPGNYDAKLSSLSRRAMTEQKIGAGEREAAEAPAKADLNKRNIESEIRERNAQADKLESPDKEKLDDITKEFSDALAKGDQKRIDALTPRVKEYLEATQKPGKDPAEKSTKEQLQAQIAAADAKGDKATVKTLQTRLKAIDPEGQQRIGVTIQGQQNANERAEKAATRSEVRAHDKAYVEPAEAVEKSYQMMDSAYKEYQAARAQGKELPTGAQSMLALSTHLSTTFGNVKGSRITKDMIEHHLGARSISDSALVAVQRLTNGDVLSPDQWEAFHSLISESRKLSWQTAEKEAKRKSIPVDFLPKDLQGGAAGGAQGVWNAKTGRYE